MKKLKKKDIEDIIALTPMQEGILFHYLKEPESNYYFEQLCLGISGDVQKELYEQAWNFVVENNEMLRTFYRWEKIEKPVQIVQKKYKPQLRYYDLLTDSVREKEKEDALETIKIKDRNETFDLKEVPYRITLCRREREKYEMIISHHHILYDGWSSGILLNEFFKAYDDLRKGKKLEKRPKTKFKEFVNCIQSRDLEKEDAFWKKYLEGCVTAVEIPLKDGKRGTAPTKDSNTPGNFQVQFENNVKVELEKTARWAKVTPAALIYTAWALLLQKYNNCDDVIFGTTVSLRSEKIKSIEDIVGLLINTVPLRVHTHAGERIKDLLFRVNDVLRMREAFENTSLVNIKKYSEWDNRAELFDSIVVIENYPLDQWLKEADSELSLTSYSISEITHYDLAIGVSIFDLLEMTFMYSTGVFNEASIAELSLHLSHMLLGIIKNPGKKITEIELLTAKERKQVLMDFNRTGGDFPGFKTISRIFEEQAGETPAHTALEYLLYGSKETPSSLSVNYEQLNEKVNQLARMLIGKGVSANSIVGIMTKPSMEMIIGILGVLKAGGAYLPIDPAYPRERIEFILRDSGAALLLTQKCFKLQLNTQSEIIFLDDPFIYNGEKKNVGNTSQSLDIAYVLYTSGSTGKPKGVIVEHYSVVNILFALFKVYPLTGTDCYLLKTSYVFDVSVTELFSWFLGGSRLVILGKDEYKDPQKILSAIAFASITHVNFVPSLFNVFVEQLNHKNIFKLSTLKYIFLAGEALSPALVNNFRKLDSKIVLENIYGPTEAAVYASRYSLEEWDSSGADVPIGKPMQNVRLYILGKNMLPQPLGFPGELTIAGTGVARGYLNRPELTAEKFVQTPFTNDRLYRTGDLARWLPDGNVKFIGRVDHQIKIRGFRVELGEIENQLLKHKDIIDVVVVVKETVDAYLCAYFTARKGLASSQLREYLFKHLPHYMVPSYFIQLEKIPLLPNGKIDRRALPLPETTVEGESTAPRDELEKKIAVIWAQVLEIDKENVRIDHNFFEYGGHSLKATRLLARIYKEFNVKVTLGKFFEIPTIRRLSHHMKPLTRDKYTLIKPAPLKEYYPLSPAQMGIYLVQQMDSKGTGYNIPSVVRLEGKIEREKIEDAFKTLIKRHESLRTSFPTINDIPMQKIHPEVEFGIEYYDIASGIDGEPDTESTVNKILASLIKPFDLTQVPLIRVGLIKLNESKYILLVDMHHLIADGTSLVIILKEFIGLYKGTELPPLEFQYKDFSEWQRHEMQRETIDIQEAYWLKQFEKEAPLLELPTDFERPANWRFEGDFINYWLDHEETDGLKRVALEEETTLYIVLVAIFYVFFSRLTGQEDIVIGNAVIGRLHTEFEPIMGMCVNTLPLRNFPRGEQTFNQFLKAVKERTLEAYENQEYPFQCLVEKLSIKREAGRNPLFDVIIGMQNPDMPRLEIPGLEIVRDCEYKINRARYDLLYSIEDRNGELFFNMEYSTDLFKKETIKNFIKYFKEIVSCVQKDKHVRLDSIEISHDFYDKQLEIPKVDFAF
jgi:tyrocidine synthetase-3